MKQARLEAGQRAAQTADNWDEGGKTDQFTLDQMRYAGAHCRILGTFRMNLDVETGEWQLEYGGDIDNFYAGQGMKVYKPVGEALTRIVNFTRREEGNTDPVQIGKLRYAAAIRNHEAPRSRAGSYESRGSLGSKNSSIRHDSYWQIQHYQDHSQCRFFGYEQRKTVNESDN